MAIDNCTFNDTSHHSSDFIDCVVHKKQRYLIKCSLKKCLMLVIAGSILVAVNMIIDKHTEWVDKANDYLKWIDKSITMPEWMNHIMNALAVICVLSAVALFFSKKKVIEISFTDKRICVPQTSLTRSEYNMRY